MRPQRRTPNEMATSKALSPNRGSNRCHRVEQSRAAELVDAVPRRVLRPRHTGPVSGDKRGVQVDDQVPASGFPAVVSHGNRVGSPRSATRCMRILACTVAILSGGRSSANSGVRRTVVSLRAAPKPTPGAPAGDVVHAASPEHDRRRHVDLACLTAKDVTACVLAAHRACARTRPS
jgi:hypothetical protein